MPIAMLLLGIWAVILIAPDTPAGRFLHRLFIEAPAARLARITRGQILLVLLLIAIGAGLTWIMEGDGLRLMSMAAPEITTWIVTFEVSTYLDILVALAMASSALRYRAVRHRIGTVLGRMRRGVRAGRARKARRPKRPAPANDDEHGGWMKLAA